MKSDAWYPPQRSARGGKPLFDLWRTGQSALAELDIPNPSSGSPRRIALADRSRAAGQQEISAGSQLTPSSPGSRGAQLERAGLWRPRRIALPGSATMVRWIDTDFGLLIGGRPAAVRRSMTGPTVLGPARRDQFPSMKSTIISRTASTICTPFAVLQPAAWAACNSGVTPCPAITSPTNIEGVSKFAATGSGSPEAMPIGVALHTMSEPV